MADIREMPRALSDETQAAVGGSRETRAKSRCHALSDREGFNDFLRRQVEHVNLVIGGV
jgi:hypothetical protein